MMKYYIVVALLVSAAIIDHTYGSCNVDACKVPMGNDAKALCKAYGPYIDCVETNIVKNKDCPDAIKSNLQTSLNQIRKDLSACSGVAGLMSSLALCLGLSSVAYILTSFK